MKKLNRKGYMTIEVVISSVIAFTVAFFLMELTMKLVNVVDAAYVDTQLITDKGLIIRNVRNYLQMDINDNGKITSVNKNGNIVTITFSNNFNASIEIDNDNGKIIYKKGTEKVYSKKVSDKLSNVTLKSVLLSSDYFYLKISAENIFSNKNYDIDIMINNNIGMKGLTFVNYLTNLYEVSSKNQIENNSISYNADPSIGLMNDRLGGSEEDGNIRYYGGDPDNYIYFNCDNYNNQNSNTCELWRIIGLFDVIEVDEETKVETTKRMVKIVRNDSIGNYSWDTSESTVNNGYGVNQWGPSDNYTGADLMKLLNTGYEGESVNNSLYWNRKNGTCYSGSSNATTDCDFTSSGIKDDVTKNMIANVKWTINTIPLYKEYNENLCIYANQFYQKEATKENIDFSINHGAGYDKYKDSIIRNNTWIGKIALPYPSDFGYATDFNKCPYKLCSTDTESNFGHYTDCKDNNYLSSVLIGSWLISPFSLVNSNKCPFCVASVYHSGNTGINYGTSQGNVPTNSSNAVHPTLYLKDNSVIYKGNGSIENPYQLRVVS